MSLVFTQPSTKPYLYPSHVATNSPASPRCAGLLSSSRICNCAKGTSLANYYAGSLSQ
jgi:hypothetical protein